MAYRSGKRRGLASERARSGARASTGIRESPRCRAGVSARRSPAAARVFIWEGSGGVNAEPPSGGWRSARGGKLVLGKGLRLHFALQDGDERLHAVGIELDAGAALQLQDRLFESAPGTVGAR